VEQKTTVPLAAYLSSIVTIRQAACPEKGRGEEPEAGVDNNLIHGPSRTRPGFRSPVNELDDRPARRTRRSGPEIKIHNV